MVTTAAVGLFCLEVNFNLCSNLNDQVVDLEFLINAIKAKGYEINGMRMDLNPTTADLEKFNIERAEKKLELLTDCKKETKINGE